MAAGALEQEVAEQPRCWCCGTPFDDTDLTRLGDHPEVAVCSGCAHWLWRRARSQQAGGGVTPGAIARRAFHLARAGVVRVGMPDWPVVGPILRGLDRYLP
jgi:hypothetical protein